ncbi:MAG: hypothetical protein ACJAWV_003389 [Flammeovirgaceae bacterium]|jgi:membrane-bound lytic murein transglycosylase D
MKNLQNTIILILLIGLVAFTIYDKMQTKPQPIVEQIRYETELLNIEMPEKMDFCGETVPLKELAIRERLDRDLHSNSFFHSNTILIMKRANRWFPRMRKILKEEGIPDDFIYLPVVESALTNVISPAGATGFWQFMRGTGKEMGLTINGEVDERYDPIKSTRAACKYLKQAYKRFGDWTLVAASYNMGMSGLGRRISKQKADSYYDLHLNSETARYVFRILAFKEILSNPDKYKFKIKSQYLYPEEKVKYVTVTESIRDLAQFAKNQGISYNALKFYNPWLRNTELKIKKGKSYNIAIPTQITEAEEADMKEGKKDLEEVKKDSL